MDDTKKTDAAPPSAARGVRMECTLWEFLQALAAASGCSVNKVLEDMVRDKVAELRHRRAA